jgi:hypothetical protein
MDTKITKVKRGLWEWRIATTSGALMAAGYSRSKADAANDANILLSRRFTIDRINEINELRREAILHAESQAAVERLDAEVLRLREAVEKH